MTNQINNTEKRIIVAFHIGRGGQFYNAGHKSFIGELNLKGIISVVENAGSWLFERNRDDRGRFCKPYLVDSNGNELLDCDEYVKEVGSIDLDGDYDTTYCCYLDDCDEEELQLISNYDGYKSNELDEEIEKL